MTRKCQKNSKFSCSYCISQCLKCKTLKCSDISSEGRATMEEFTGTKEYEENININSYFIKMAHCEK